MCTFFKRNNCAKGDNCDFPHIETRAAAEGQEGPRERQNSDRTGSNDPEGHRLQEASPGSTARGRSTSPGGASPRGAQAPDSRGNAPPPRRARGRKPPSREPSPKEERRQTPHGNARVCVPLRKRNLPREIAEEKSSAGERASTDAAGTYDSARRSPEAPGAPQRAEDCVPFSSEWLRAIAEEESSAGKRAFTDAAGDDECARRSPEAPGSPKQTKSYRAPSPGKVSGCATSSPRTGRAMWCLPQSATLTLSSSLPLPSGGRNEEGEEEEEDKGTVDISMSMKMLSPWVTKVRRPILSPICAQHMSRALSRRRRMLRGRKPLRCRRYQ